MSTKTIFWLVVTVNALALLGCSESGTPTSDDKRSRVSTALVELQSPVWGQSIEDIQGQHADG